MSDDMIKNAIECLRDMGLNSFRSTLVHEDDESKFIIVNDNGVPKEKVYTKPDPGYSYTVNRLDDFARMVPKNMGNENDTSHHTANIAISVDCGAVCHYDYPIRKDRVMRVPFVYTPQYKALLGIGGYTRLSHVWKAFNLELAHPYSPDELAHHLSMVSYTKKESKDLKIQNTGLANSKGERSIELSVEGESGSQRFKTDWTLSIPLFTCLPDDRFDVHIRFMLDLRENGELYASVSILNRDAVEQAFENRVYELLAHLNSDVVDVFIGEM